MKARYPQAAHDRKVSPLSQEYTALRLFEDAINIVIRSFPTGSPRGPNGIRPQHILVMINNNGTGPVLLTSITNFVNRLLRGECHRGVVPFLFCERLTALERKSGCIRPIAIGHTLWRTATKMRTFLPLIS